MAVIVGRRTGLGRWIAGLAIAISVTRVAAAPAEDRMPTLYTNQHYVEDVTRQSVLDVENIKSVLAYVLSQLPERVKVFPTENYYYFYFYLGGVKYAGNFRFDVGVRDAGKFEFIYFKDSSELARDPTDHHATLGKEDGALLEKLEDLVYRLTFQGRSVVFELNDLSQVRPPGDALGPDETFLGPVFDESGMRFFLVFNEKLKLFHYVLDETIPVSDDLVGRRRLPHIQIGLRTSFAFFDDPMRKRKLLVGVFGPNVAVNSYLDGPFDQLPDNFLKGDALRRALLVARPELESKGLDRLGIDPGGDYREMIAPYLEYSDPEDLEPLEKCAENTDSDTLYRCLDAATKN